MKYHLAKGAMTIENDTTSEAVSDDPAIEVPATATPEVEEIEPPAEDATPTDADKAAKALQRRVDRLTREKYQLKAENDQLRAPKPQDDEPKQLTEDEVETRAEIRAREIAEVKQFNDQCNTVFEKGVKANKEFAKSFKELTEEIGSPFDAKGKPTSIMAAILDADAPHKVILHLAEDLDLAAEIAALSPTRQIRRIAKIESDLEEAAKPKQSSAPKPVQPVKASPDVSSAPDPKDTKRWIEYENQREIAQRAKR